MILFHQVIRSGGLTAKARHSLHSFKEFNLDFWMQDREFRDKYFQNASVVFEE